MISLVPVAESHLSCLRSHSTVVSFLGLGKGPPKDRDTFPNQSLEGILIGRLFGYGSTIVRMTTLACPSRAASNEHLAFLYLILPLRS